MDEGKVGVRLRHNSKLTDSCHNYNIKFQLSITEQITYLHNDKAQKVGSTQQSHTSQKKSGHYFHKHTGTKMNKNNNNILTLIQKETEKNYIT